MIRFRLPWYRSDPVQTSRSAGDKICRALGLEPKDTQDVVIHVEVGNFIWFEARHLLRESQMNRITGFFTDQKFQMIEESEVKDLCNKDELVEASAQGQENKTYTY